MAKKVSVLFVCLGNICRSPTAHGVFRKMVKDEGLDKLIEIDSAGTAAYHVGNPPDKRSTQVAFTRGIHMSDLRARQVDFGDFYQYDYILAMDVSNYHNLLEMAPDEYREKVQLFLDYSREFDEKEVPDPYYGGPQGFDHVFDLVESASKGLLEHVRRHYL
ncbi:low molecular weight protein-tyrosine-phosphatase [Thiomicrorhabdus heinhorstiae]|uniref:Low molecular weight phosphotyrosine protein phosphatase n=1 Tax=Thiomicrorhabdus heinhorstiae TaxID=2748010 RepID=A0ABS0BWB7_9GAMM|nr:low molecular weight protein-tyrosine-phosphatase [Thiomicrorhabdus heinhorstiae]MBF6057269.1 low molecular weight phosphotyrosine protein phosphatase [Thiomicrorhabdus heinhorstiae]